MDTPNFDFIILMNRRTRFNHADRVYRLEIIYSFGYLNNNFLLIYNIITAIICTYLNIFYT